MSVSDSLHPDADTTVTHHEECDGLRLWCLYPMRRSGRYRGGMWAAECSQCDWKSGWSGSWTTAVAMAQGKVRGSEAHPQHDGLCRGECSDWED
jgi:hypothetical protein